VAELVSKSEQKKLSILVAGLEVMRRQGYNGTSVKDIVCAAKVPKGSFYNYFDSKESFVIEAIEYVANEALQDRLLVLEDSTLSGLKRLELYFDRVIASACSSDYRFGCFLGTMCQEMADNSEAVRSTLRDVMHRQNLLIQRVLDDSELVEHNGAVPDTHVLAAFLSNAWQGALMSMKTTRSREPLDAFLQILPVFFKN